MPASRNKTIVITGASSGIGDATAAAFSALGWRIIAGARRLNLLTERSSSWLQAGAKEALCLELDVCRRASVEAFSKKVVEVCPEGFDVLLNNAGLALGVDRIQEGREDDWDAMLQTNVMGVLRVSRSLIPHMTATQRGHVINIGSISGFTVYEGGGVYCASKHAVRAITKTLRLELNGTPIRVTSIDPGMVETDFSNARFNDSERAKAVYRGLTPLSSQDVADCVVWSALRPAHVNIDEIVVMPVAQAAPHKVHRQPQA